jgi:flagellar FliL protein
MSDKANDTPKKKKGGLILKLALGLGLVGIGGGGAFALVATGMIGHKAAKEDNSPKLIRKGEKDPFAPPATDGHAEGAGVEAFGEGGTPYRTVYFTFTDEFTVNLKSSTTLLQASLACSTQYDGRVLQWVKTHELAIRSALLEEMANTSEDDLVSPDGKEQLRKRLAAAINTVLIHEEGFGGVNAVYFKSFIVQ